MRISAYLRPCFSFAFAAMLLSALPFALQAAETSTEAAVDQRDFSAEAAARHADRFEALRDPELRRHYLDQLESRRWSDLERRTRSESKLAPGGGPPAVDLPPEIRHLQRALGGPQVDQFPSLRPDGFDAVSPPSRGDRSPRGSQREVIRALRDAATQLDATANRLEQLDLYRQADGLRHQAQQLRIDARGFDGDPQTTPTPSAPTPTSWEQWPTPRAPQPTLLPDVTPQPTLNSIPTPSPTPEGDPRILDDQPKPQPLNDSPASSPIVEPVLED